MSQLSKDLISQFVSLTKNNEKNQNGSTVYGTIKKLNDIDYVQIDGSDLMTPVKTTTYVSDGERVIVSINNHQAIVTGNISSPATRQTDVENTVGLKINEFDIILAKELEVKYATIETLRTEYATIAKLETEYATIAKLETEYATITKLETEYATINKLETEYATINKLETEYATINKLETEYATINKLETEYATINKLETEYATIAKLEAEYATIENLKANYANIDFANIGMAAIEKIFSTSGIIKDLVVGDQSITGELVGVTIKGDLIEANTLVADKLVVKGEDGLYYKLNTDGIKVEAEQTDYNSLNGSIITAKSITASKISVDDLVAFNATIGGFNITNHSIYSGVKKTIDNTTKGVYLDNQGQLAVGDTNNFLKFFRDTDGKWKLNITANSISLTAFNSTLEDSIKDMSNKIQSTTKSIVSKYAISSSYTVPPTTGWSDLPPKWIDGMYIWSKTVTTYTDGNTNETSPVCITGAKGSNGVGISSIVNYYLAHTLNTGVTTSTTGWSTTMQSMTSVKKYLWNYEQITYTNNNITTTNPVVIGVYGDKGQNGNDGKGIKSIVEKYAVSNDSTTAPTTWHDTVQTMSSSNRYLWNYEIITYTDSTTSETAKRIIGVYGDSGIGISSVDVEYCLSNSNTNLTNPDWSTDAPQWVDGMYMWSRTKTTKSNGISVYSNPVCITGGKGQTGSSGKGVKSTSVTYQASTSGVTTPSGSWSETIPTVAAGQYLWTRTITTYTDATTSTSYSIGKMGESGQNGNDGKGVKSTSVMYQASTSGVTIPSGSWVSSIPSVSAGQYLWTRTIITYTDNSTSTSYSIGKMGEKGDVGQGVESITEEYYLSNSKSTQSGGQWTTTPPTWSPGMYIWTRSKIVYKNPTKTEYTDPLCDSSWEAINDIKVGGRNLLPGTKDFKYGKLIDAVLDEKYMGLSILGYSNIGTTHIDICSWNGLNVKSDTYYTLSYYVKGDGKFTSYLYPTAVLKSTCSDGTTNNNSDGGTTMNLPTEWTRKWVTWKTLSGINSVKSLIPMRLNPGSTGYICGVKFEEGNMPSDWSPAPEDIDESFTVVENRLSTVEFDLQKNQIVAKVQDTFTTKTESAILKNQLDQNKQNIRCNDLGAKINYSSFTYQDPGEMYLHGYDEYNNPVDTNGKIYWAGKTVTVPKGMLNPNSDMCINDDIYIFMNVTNQSSVMGGWYDYKTKWWKYKRFIGGTDSGAFTPSPDHVCIGIMNMRDAETFNYAFLFDTPQSLKNLTTGPADIISRINSAEQKITSEAIINTVSKTITDSKNEAIKSANSTTDEKLKSYATTATVTQTAKDVTYAFTSSGGYNLLRNSDANNGTTYWLNNGGGLSTGISGGNIFKGQTEFQSSFPSGIRYYQPILLKGDTDYIYEGWIYSATNYEGTSSRSPLHFWCSTTTTSSDINQCTILDFRQKLVAGDFSKVYVHFKTKSGTVYFTPFVYGGPTGNFSVHQLSLTEGKVEKAWTPHPSEIYDGSTIIDASGVTIKNGAIKVQNNNGDVVLTGDSGGNLNLKGSINVNTNEGHQLYINTQDSKYPVLVGTASGVFSRKFTVADDFAAWYDGRAYKGVDITSSGISSPSLKLTGELSVNGHTVLNGSDTWLRTYGDTGWFSATYGGGWYMTDSTWIRSYGSKNIYINSLLRADGGLQVGNSGSSFAVSSTGTVVASGIITSSGGFKVTSGNLTFSQSNAEQRIAFDDCSSDSSNVYLYKGSSSSTTILGLYDQGAASAVWRYVNDDTFVIERQVSIKGHVVPYNTKSYWLGTNSPDKKWKGVCCEGGTVGASDIRNKENIRRLDGSVVSFDELSEEIVEYQLYNLIPNDRAAGSEYYEFLRDRFKPTYYNYKLSNAGLDPLSEYNMLKNVGFIAQDYDLDNDPVAREFIFKDDGDRYAYNHMSYVTVGMIALQETINKVEKLIQDNEKLKQKNIELESRLNRIEDLLIGVV